MSKETEKKNKEKDGWDKLAVVSALVASVLVPVAIALVGHFYTSAIKQAENNVKYTELAISILKENPTDENDEVREWAVDVINEYSGVSMSADVRAQLVGKRLMQSNFTNSDFRGSLFKGSNFVTSNFILSRFDGSFFQGSSFKNAILSDSDFSGADLSSVIFDDKTKFPK